MRASEFLIEYGRYKTSRKGIRPINYRDGGTPDWFDKAVQLKTDNTRMSATEIGRQSNPPIHAPTVLAWLAGAPDSGGNIVNDNPPFKPKDFPNIAGKKYFDGAKPWWYEEAVKLRKRGMTWQAISNKISTPEERVASKTINNWLVKGIKYQSGKLMNPDAPFDPRLRAKKIDTAEIEELIDARFDDADIIKYIQDKKGDKIANQVRAMLPQLRQKLNPGTSVIDKTRTGNMKDTDITGLVQ